MAGALSIRLAEDRDRAAFETLWAGWQMHMGGRVPPEVTALSWRKIVTPGSGLEALLAFANEEAAGFGIVSRTPFAWTGEDILYLQDLFVAGHMRGRGVGAALLKAIYAHADAAGASQVFWMVDDGDPGLEAFYDRHALRTPYRRYTRWPWPW
jgi:GNAT superfamily N-acetyltransferase